MKHKIVEREPLWTCTLEYTPHLHRLLDHQNSGRSTRTATEGSYMTFAELTGQCLVATSILVLAWVLNEVKKELRTWSIAFANGVNAVNGTACNLAADCTYTFAKEIRGNRQRSRSRSRKRRRTAERTPTPPYLRSETGDGDSRGSGALAAH